MYLYLYMYIHKDKVTVQMILKGLGKAETKLHIRQWYQHQHYRISKPYQQ